MLARLIGVGAFVFLCGAAQCAVPQRYYDVDAAMSQWNDAKIRHVLHGLGVVGGSYKVSSSGDGFIVEAILLFKGGGKMAYRKYHSASAGFPGPITLARLYLRAKM